MQRVLIVDDIPENLYFLEVLLKGHGFEVVSAKNGAEALASARAATPDLTISDILMPVLDGYALCREWRADDRLKAIPFIFYTATFTEKKDEELALGLGADLFLVKPMEPEELITAVRTVLTAAEHRCAPVEDPLSEEMRLLKGYNEALFKKLEKKMRDLEEVNRELRERIEEQKVLEEQLRHAQKMEAVGRFSAGIAHDFNNILTVILGFGGMMRMQRELDLGMRDKLDKILEAADRAKSLAASLLTFSRKQPVKLQSLDVNGAVRGVETFLRRVIGDDVILSLSVSPEPLTVLADKGHLEQVLMNLAVNARDAMPKGGTLSIETAVREIGADFVRLHGCGTPGLYALLSVSDTGIGMDLPTSQKIFEPFFTTKERGHGTGLGLAIVYGIVQQHHGFIHVYSEQGQGTTFRILLPLVDGVAEAEAVADREPPPRGQETILVVDNEEPIREYLDLFLSSLGYTVYQARDGAEAVRLFCEKQEEIDLVLMDVIMPYKTGREAALEIRGFRPDAKVLFISGYSHDLISERHLTPDDAEVIMKPVTPSELALKVREILGGCVPASSSPCVPPDKLEIQTKQTKYHA